MISPTPRQMDVLRFIAGYQRAKRCCPSYREIAKGIGVRGHVAAHALVISLEERRLARAIPGKVRAIEILVPVDVPTAPDGAPLYAVKLS